MRFAESLAERLPDESEKDHAKRLGLLGEARGGGPLFGCRYCADLPWRRAPGGCFGCGGAHAPETVQLDGCGPVSNAAFMDGSYGLGSIGIVNGRNSAGKRKQKAA